MIPDAEKKYDLSSLRICTGGGESLTAATYVIHEKGKPWARSLTTEEAFTEIGKILFPNEDVRIVRMQSDPPKVELLIEKS